MPEAHGGIRPRELIRLGIDPAQVIDFSVNANPFGPPEGLKKYLFDVDLSRYPDPDAFELKKALSEVNETPADYIVVGNGSVELIWACVRAFMGDQEAALVVAPTFGEYQRALNSIGVRSETFNLDLNSQVINTAAIANKIDRLRPRLTFICNPNNPTGHACTEEQISQIAQACASVDGVLVVDEAYRVFAGLSQFAPHKADNVITLRSMTKDFAIPALRLGYALAKPAYSRWIAAQCPPWSVSSIAQKAGGYLLANPEITMSRIADTLDMAKQFRRQLSELGYQPLPSAAHYFLLEVGDATQFRRQLLEYSILVRDCTSFGLPSHIRLATQQPKHNQRLCEVLAQI